jgi:hypothetical protein
LTTTPSAPDWRKIVPPPRLARRPRDQRGFVIPFSVDDGTDHPDFRITQADKLRELLNKHLCWLCGEALDYWMCFIGGPLSITNRSFTDGPMHEACAVYALRVCPFLASPNGRYTSSEDNIPEGGGYNQLVADTRPELFGLGFTHGYKTGVAPNGMLFMRAESWRKVIWYSHAGQVVRRQIFDNATRTDRKKPRNRHG